MARPKKVVTIEVDKAEWDKLNEKVESLDSALVRLMDLLTEKPEKGPRRPKATEAQLQTLYVRRAHAMRQGRAAKRLNMTRAQFRQRFGDIDFVPEGAEPLPQSTPPDAVLEPMENPKRRRDRRRAAEDPAERDAGDSE